MNFLTRLRDRPEWIAVMVALVAVIVTVAYSQMQLNQSTRAMNFNTFSVLRSTYLHTRNEYWKHTRDAFSKSGDELEFHTTLTERFFRDHLDAIELTCRLFTEDRLGSDGVQFVNSTIKRDIKTFKSDELKSALNLLGIKSEDIPTC